jgi:mannose-6-phosphate isomerase-like protein (cupin superfamily)
VPDPPEVKRAELSRVDKPWGYELRWAVTDRYLGKLLHVNRGEALSLQYHERKDEYQYVVAGSVDIEVGGPDGDLTTLRLGVGDTLHIKAGTRHRLTAIDDTDIFEVSTPEGEDVVRIADRYGRAPA